MAPRDFNLVRSRFNLSSKRNVIFLRGSEMHSNLETSEIKSIILLRYLFLSKTTPLPLPGRATMIDLLGAISDKIYRDLYASGCGPGVLYGLPMVHEAKFHVNFPMRPILAAYSTPSYRLARYLVPLLTPFSLSKYCIAKSSSYSKQISELNLISGNSFMAFLDVESLYTNVSYQIR